MDNQLRREKDFLLPEPVYRQVVWTLKDLTRMKERLKELKEDAYQVGGYDMAKPSSGYKGLILSDITANKATSIAMLSSRIEAVESGFDFLPMKYRDGIYNKLIYDVPYPDEFHINTWRKWQQKVIFKIALNLGLL